MKKIITASLVLCFGLTTSNAQVNTPDTGNRAGNQHYSSPLSRLIDTLVTGDRVSNYYYWDTNWWDYYWLNYPNGNTEIYSHYEKEQVSFVVSSNQSCRSEYARYCYTEKPMSIIGVAGMVYTDPPTSSVDSLLLPEYFRLYEVGKGSDAGSMHMLAEAQWSNSHPRHMMVAEEWQMSTGHSDSTIETIFPVYEAYFNTPVVVHDSFYVSGTAENSFTDWHEEEYTLHDSVFMINVKDPNYPRVRYVGALVFDNNVSPNPSHYKIRAHYIDNVFNNSFSDTNWHVYSTRHFMALFPIFDTSYGTSLLPGDTCAAPYDLRADLSAHAEGSALLMWNDANDADQWELSLCRDCSEPEMGNVMQHTENFVNLTGLDTGAWYTAWVRTVCRNNMVSDWSGNVQFYVPGNTGQGTEAIETPDDSYTLLMPNPASGTVTVMSSFQLQKVEIYSMDGRMLLQKKAGGIAATVDIGTLPTGTYFVRIETYHGTVFKRLVVK